MILHIHSQIKIMQQEVKLGWWVPKGATSSLRGAIGISHAKVHIFKTRVRKV